MFLNTLKVSMKNDVYEGTLSRRNVSIGEREQWTHERATDPDEDRLFMTERLGFRSDTSPPGQSAAPHSETGRAASSEWLRIHHEGQVPDLRISDETGAVEYACPPPIDAVRAANRIRTMLSRRVPVSTKEA